MEFTWRNFNVITYAHNIITKLHPIISGFLNSKCCKKYLDILAWIPWTSFVVISCPILINVRIFTVISKHYATNILWHFDLYIRKVYRVHYEITMSFVRALWSLMCAIHVLHFGSFEIKRQRVYKRLKYRQTDKQTHAYAHLFQNIEST